MRELANAEKINQSYVSRVLRLTLLSPTIVEAILDGQQPANLELDDLLKQFPVEWDRQLGSRPKRNKRQVRFASDSVAKVVLHHRSKIFRAVGTAIDMWGTTASSDELTGDFGGTFEATSIGDRSLFRPFAEN